MKMTKAIRSSITRYSVVVCIALFGLMAAIGTGGSDGGAGGVISGTAGGTYYYDGSTLTLTVDATTFPNGRGPSAGGEVHSVAAVTALTMTWTTPDPVTWMRSSGAAGDILGTWEMESDDGWDYELTFNEGGTFSATGSGYHVNSPPVSNAGSDLNVLTGALVTLDGSGSSDADGNDLTYSWSLISKPDGSAAVISNEAAVMPSFTADSNGTYVIRLIVDDGTVASAPDSVTIAASASIVNVAPVSNAGSDLNIPAGTLVTLDGSGSSDADGDDLTYSWSLISKPDGSAAALSNAAAVDPTFTADKNGSYVIQLVVNDGTVSSAPDSITITGLMMRAIGVPYAAVDGLAVTLNSFAVTKNADYYEYAINYTLVNNSKNSAIYEGTFKLFYLNRDGSVPQYDIAGILYPGGDTITRSYTFEQLGDELPYELLQYHHDHSSDNRPVEEALHWKVEIP